MPSTLADDPQHTEEAARRLVAAARDHKVASGVLEAAFREAREAGVTAELAYNKGMEAGIDVDIVAEVVLMLKTPPDGRSEAGFS